MLSDAVRALTGVPDHYTDEYNSFTVLNYWCLIEEVIDALDVRSICEIGSDRGDTSRQLIARAEAGALTCHIVDPVADPALETMATAGVEVHRTTSLAYLAAAGRSDLYIVDGDHNYWTVSREVAEILRHAGADRPLALMFHDTGWPCARRDFYYAAGDVPDKRPNRYDSGVHLKDEALNDGRSFPGGQAFAWAEHHGGAGNGVLTALEDSPLYDDAVWLRLTLPSFYGLHIFVERASLPGAAAARLARLSAAIEALRPLLAIHEANRLRLLQGLMETQRHRDRLIARVGALERKLAETAG